MKFLRAILFVALMIGGGYCLATELDPLGKKGLNMPYHFGNVTYIWCKKPGNTMTYNSTRFRNLMTQSDWNNIQHAFDNVIIGYRSVPNGPAVPIYQFESTGFDHVRVPLEPMAFCNPDGQVPSEQDDTKWLNVQALAYQIWLIKTAGLSVILDLHPDVRTNYQYQTTYSTSIITGKESYPGPCKFDLATAYNQPGEVFIPATHPLVKFWASFPEQLNLAYQNLIENPQHLALDPNKVFFEILNEPLIDISRIDFPSSHELSDPNTFQQKIGDWRTAWRTIQLAAIQQIRNWNPSFRTIATTAYSDPRDLGNISTYQGGYFFGNAYNKIDLSEAYENQVIYNVHFYEPFRLTHRQLPGTHAGYQYFRDFLGQWEHPGDDLIEAKNPHFRGLPNLDTVNGFLTYAGHEAMNFMFTQIYNWRINNTVQVIIDEFGCARLDLATNKIFEQPSTAGQIGAEENLNGWRQTWYSDARKKMQNDGYTWTAFDYTGGFSVYTGQLFDTINPDLHYDHGVIKPYMRDALFDAGLFVLGEGDDG